VRRRDPLAVLAKFTRTATGWHNETLDAVLRESRVRAKRQRRYRTGKGNGKEHTARH
jgi:hypothetical protein